MTEIEAFVVYDNAGRRYWLYLGNWLKRPLATRRLRRYIEP
ncbi:MAG TPA: hypothetical protein VNN25_01765 [Thermoanaerobaculia bacterium]|nr:hypothetical protein [Thermoanaerobaculia bacterium]